MTMKKYYNEVGPGYLYEPEDEDEEYLKDGLRHCPKCNEPRQFKTVVNGQEMVLDIMCSCLRKKFEDERDQFQKRQRQMHIDDLRKGIVDKRFREFTFDKSEESLDFAHKYVADFKKYLNENIGLMLLGGVGTGKTFAAACIANALVDQEYSVYMANMLHVADKVSHLYDEDRDEYIRSLEKYSLLILDDFGVDRATDFTAEQIYNVVETRYRSGKPLIITSNLTLDDLKNCTDIRLARTYDRIKEMCHPIIMTGQSKRKEMANERYLRLKKELG